VVPGPGAGRAADPAAASSAGPAATDDARAAAAAASNAGLRALGEARAGSAAGKGAAIARIARPASGAAEAARLGRRAHAPWGLRARAPSGRRDRAPSGRPDRARPDPARPTGEGMPGAARPMETSDEAPASVAMQVPAAIRADPAVRKALRHVVRPGLVAASAPGPGSRARRTAALDRTAGRRDPVSLVVKGLRPAKPRMRPRSKRARS